MAIGALNVTTPVNFNPAPGVAPKPRDLEDTNLQRDRFEPSSSSDAHLTYRPYQNGSSNVGGGGGAGGGAGEGGGHGAGGGSSLTEADRPKWYNRAAHLGYNEQETATINRFDTNLASVKHPHSLGKEAAEALFTHMVGDVVLPATLSAAVGASHVLEMGTNSLAGSAQNAHVLGAMGDYGDWRDAHPQANPAEIKSYVESQVGVHGSSYTGLSSALSSGTLSLSDDERHAIMDNRPAIIGTMLERTYQDMNQLYPASQGGWSLPDRSITL